MCIWLPDWPLQRIRYTQPEYKNRSLVLYADASRAGPQIVACSPAAAERGVAAGMSPVEAEGLLTTRRSRSDAALFIPHEPDDDADGLRGLAVWCQRFSPTVGIEEPDGLLLDVSGCAHLFGGEHQLSRQFIDAVSRWGFSVRTAIADTIGTAWAVARFGTDRTTIVPAGRQEAALRPLSVQSLRLSKNAIETLNELNIHRIGQLQSLPRSGLYSRLGPEVARRLDQALGTVAELIVPVRRPEPLQASEDFEHPIRDRRTLEIVLRRLVERIAEKAAESQHGVQRLEVAFFDAAGGSTGFVIETLRPDRSASHLMELVQTRLEQTPFAQGVVGVRMEAIETKLLKAPQGGLFDVEDDSDGRGELARLVDRMSNRLGKQRVVRPRLRPDAQPEFALRWEPLLDANKRPETQPFQPPHTRPASSRPLHLREEPVALEVTSAAPDGPPLRFFWKHAACTVARCWGPERIETGWWRERHVRRDYYRVETESGRRFWLFRRIGQGDWFLHGEFA